MKVVVVESPSKAKTINKYLGSDYKVLASYGHVRDLPSKDGSVDPDNHFSMIWETDEKSRKQLSEIKKALKGADQLLLATDPDREGEAISWHVQNVLQEEKALQNIDVKRVVFYEVTKNAVLDAMAHPRDLNKELIDAYLARRALDYLVGFTLSPVLWRKLPGSRSAGRVQSVALRLVAERESEIEAFRSQEYWSVIGQFFGAPDRTIESKLTIFNGKKLDKFDLNTEALAKAAVNEIERHAYSVAEIAKKQIKRSPSAPFTTSTLQQEASRKLGFGARKTMQLAQRLYEGVDLGGGETVGLITYMRTDSLNVSTEAVQGTRAFIQKKFGDKYLPNSPRVYKNKAKNAQEAHEAIRPTDLQRAPESVRSVLDSDQFKLYELIWKRMVASQMENALIDQVGADILSADKKIAFRATGSTVAFDGFMILYQEDQDDAADEESKMLPPLKEGEKLDLREIVPHQHFTQPPPRYTEASLVKKMEELGIGRPSTYASILSTLLDRKYVTLEKKRLLPQPLGRLVTSFLKAFFCRYVEYDFTANLEEKLDDISNGTLTWTDVLSHFWSTFSATAEEAKNLKFAEVIESLEKDLEPFIFPSTETGDPSKTCPQCTTGTLSLKLGKFGAFMGCSNYPECSYSRKLTAGSQEENQNPEGEHPKVSSFETRNLGVDPQTREPVTLRKGPYGFYFQWGEEQVVGKKKIKPKRVAVPKGKEIERLTLEDALSIGALPRSLGRHPETGEEIIAGLGRFGPYVKHQNKFKSLAKTDDVLTIALDRAVALLAEESKPRPHHKKSKS